MKTETPKIETSQRTTVAGFYQARVMNRDGTPAGPWTPQKKNLVLPTGYWVVAGGAYPGSFAAQMGSVHAGSGSTPNQATLDGTYEQTGTTVTRATGTGVFVSGNVGDFIKFGTGEIARISAFTNSVTVTVDRSQTVAATSLVVYDTSRTLLDTWIKATTTLDGAAGAAGNSHNTDAGTYLYWRTFNFTTETSPRTYTEIGVTANGTIATSVLFSRVLLDAPVNVDVDQFLQVRVDFLMTLSNYRTSAPITVNITGWPYTYNVQSIVSNGTYWDVTLDVDPSAHYAVGRPIIIAGALPLKTTISSISSTPTDFTVNATAHGRLVGETIVIEGHSPGGYNGTWTVATVPNANSLTVTSAINLGAGTGGTVRLATPGTWYDGTHNVASFPGGNKVRITNATVITAAGVGGTVKNSMAANAAVLNYAFQTGQPGIAEPTTGSGLNNKGLRMYPEATMASGVYGGSHGTGSPVATTTVTGTYNAATLSQTLTGTFGSSAGVSTTVRQFGWGNTSQPTGMLLVTFDERQRKDNGFQLQVSHTIVWQPDLS